MNTTRVIDFITNQPSLVSVYDRGPATTSSSVSNSLSVGGGLSASASGPGGDVSASYSRSWTQNDVNVRDQSGSNYTQWVVSFDSWSVNPWINCPPLNTTSAYSAPQAVVFQVPEGQALLVRSQAAFGYSLDTTKGNLFTIDSNRTTITDTITSHYQLQPPVFSASPASITTGAAAGSKVTLNIAASIPGGQQQVGWRITGIPPWLVVGQPSGRGNTAVTLLTQAGTAKGSVAILNVDTVPSGGANSVENGPLQVVVSAQ